MTYPQQYGPPPQGYGDPYGQPQQQPQYGPPPGQYPPQAPPQQFAAPPQQQAPAGPPPGFKAPAASTGDRARVEDLNGHTLIVAPLEDLPDFFKGKIEGGIQKPPSSAIKLNVADLDVVDPLTGRPGMVYREVIWGAKALYGSLSRTLREDGPRTAVLVRIGKGTAATGQSAPWVFLDATSDPGAVDRATRFVAERPGWQDEPPGQGMAQQAAQAAPGSPWPPGAAPAGQYAPPPQSAPPANYGPPPGQYPQQPQYPGYPPAGPPQGYPQQQPQYPGYPAPTH